MRLLRARQVPNPRRFTEALQLLRAGTEPSGTADGRLGPRHTKSHSDSVVLGTGEQTPVPSLLAVLFPGAQTPSVLSPC